MSIILPKLQQNLWDGARNLRRTLEDQTPNFVQQGCSACGGGEHDPSNAHSPVYQPVNPAYKPINTGPVRDVWNPAVPLPPVPASQLYRPTYFHTAMPVTIPGPSYFYRLPNNSICK